MRPIRFEVGITLDDDGVGTLVDAIQHVIEKAVTRSTQMVLDTVEQRAQANWPRPMPEVPPPQERPMHMTTVP